MIRIKRVYSPPARGDGVRILVDRLWPRGLKKAAARIDEWARRETITLLFGALGGAVALILKPAFRQPRPGFRDRNTGRISDGKSRARSLLSSANL